MEAVEDKRKPLSSFTVAYVKEARKHPNADRLQVCDVVTRSGLVQVVCGAPNAKTGMKAIFAPPGSYIPGTDMTLEKGIIRGVESNGMLVSERELMISNEHDGIIELDKSVPIGTPAAQALGLDDPMIYIKVTPNRPDALGIYGIARDLAAKGLGKLKPLKMPDIEGKLPLADRRVASLRRRRRHALPAVRRALFQGREERPLARMAAGAAQSDRTAADIGAGRYHQLHHLHLWQAAACLRRRQDQGLDSRAPRPARRDI